MSISAIYDCSLQITAHIERLVVYDTQLRGVLQPDSISWVVVVYKRLGGDAGGSGGDAGLTVSRKCKLISL